VPGRPVELADLSPGLTLLKPVRGMVALIGEHGDDV
jgi:hypothetical protein